MEALIIHNKIGTVGIAGHKGSRVHVSAGAEPSARREGAGWPRSASIAVAGSRIGRASIGFAVTGPGSSRADPLISCSALRGKAVRENGGIVEPRGSPGTLVAEPGIPFTLCSGFCAARSRLRLRM